MPDIDIDFADRDIILSQLNHRVAKLDTGKKHNTGVYVTECPHNPVDNLCTVDYKTAEDRGYFKLDILNVSIYEDVKDEDHLLKLISAEPDWSLLEHKEIVEQLFHVHNHFDIVNKLKPKSVEDLAAVLAIIRPAKRNLLNESWTTIKEKVWEKPQDGTYFFKKSHAVGYALAIVLQLNLLIEKTKNS